MQAQHFILKAMIYKAQERFLDQAAACMDALNVLTIKAPEETYYISAALLQYCFLARELPLHGSLKIVETALNHVAGLPAAKLQALRALGWNKVISGDYIAGMRQYSAARDLSDDLVSKVLTHLDYANAASWSGSNAAAAAEYHYANELLQRITWQNVADESPVTLLVAAQVGASIDHATARTHLDIAKNLNGKISPTFALAHGRRWTALYSEASALVAAAHDEFFEAQRQASAACEDFSRMGYCWRAGRMALLMHQLSGKQYWRDRACTLLAQYPNSVFAKQLGIEAGEVRLTRRQEQVLEFLRRGYKSEAIAAELNMARNTVHTHITAIHRAYGVQRRSELLAKLAGTV